ncbi:hypothetical protein LT493_03950 [Streptomyces tricolor]|nr:hypothetical protein [Streptomyces tricolor]
MTPSARPVRSAPTSPRCAPPGVRHAALWLDSGHDGYDGGDHVTVLRRGVVFLDRELRGPAHHRPQTPLARPERGAPHRRTPHGGEGPVQKDIIHNDPPRG